MSRLWIKLYLLLLGSSDPSSSDLLFSRLLLHLRLEDSRLRFKVGMGFSTIRASRIWIFLLQKAITAVSIEIFKGLDNYLDRQDIQG